MRLLLSTVALASATLAAACGTGTAARPAPTVSQTPRAAATATVTAAATATPPAATAAPVASATPAPQPPASPAPLAPPSPRPAPASPTPPQPSAPRTLTLVAHDLRFSATGLRAAAGVPLTIVLDNQDAGVQHDVIIYTPAGAIAASTAVTTGPATASLVFTPGPGIYPFKCSVHPQQMNGTLTVE